MIVAIIQARMGSTRLPGKVLKKVCGKTLLAHLVGRLKRSQTLDDIIIATSTDPRDKIIAEHAQGLGVKVFRGEEADVLDRYYRAACEFDVDTIVRITADCPLMDPAVMDKIIGVYQRNATRYDYVSNVNPQTFPIGMAVEVFSFSTLEKTWLEAKLPAEREHVTLFIRSHKELFRQKNVACTKDYSHCRITVDTPEDLHLVRRIFKRLSAEKKKGSLNDMMQMHIFFK